MHMRDIGQGPPLVFLHGWSCHGGFYTPQIEALSGHFRLLLPDLPGHGESHATSPQPGIPDLADALHEMLNHLQLQRPILIGWSMGAMVAFDYLQRFGQQDIGGLVIEDMTARITTDATWPLGLGGAFDAAQNAATLAAMQMDWDAFAAAFLPHLFAREAAPDPQLQQWIGAEIARNDSAMMASLWASMAAQDYRALLPQLKLPTLIIYGGASQLYAPEVSAYLEAQIPLARRICLARSGHMPHLEQSAAFNAALAEFADGLTLKSLARPASA